MNGQQTHIPLFNDIPTIQKPEIKKKWTNMNKSKTNTKVLIECGHLIHQYAVQPNRNVNN